MLVEQEVKRRLFEKRVQREKQRNFILVVNLCVCFCVQD